MLIHGEWLLPVKVTSESIALRDSTLPLTLEEIAYVSWTQ